jgi:hypothetical protein
MSQAKMKRALSYRYVGAVGHQPFDQIVEVWLNVCFAAETSRAVLSFVCLSAARANHSPQFNLGLSV